MAGQVMDDQGVMREIISRKEAIEKGLKRYFTGKPCKYGHVSERRANSGVCSECEKEYYEQNKEQIKEYSKEHWKEYYQQNKERIKEYRDQNKEYFKEYLKEYREQNKERIKENKKEYLRNRYANDPDFKTSEICRRILYRTLKATSSTKNSRTYELLGYCNEQLKESIESKLLPGMSWDNYGEWHIDHKYPVSRYIEDGITDPAIINALDNLIPMWDDHNTSKSAMTLEEFLLQEEELAEIYGEFLEVA